MIDINKNLQLFINGSEYQFSNNIEFSFHPTNFSSMTFHDVIKKDNINYPNCVLVKDVEKEFSFAQVKQDGKTIFFGTVNDSGRLSLMPNYQKTKSIIITDFRNWLSITKPLDFVWINKKPSEMVEEIVIALRIDKIQVGNLDFTIDEPIKSYNASGKTAYQILKDVIGKQTNSVLYFTFDEHNIYINYKSNNAFEKVSEIKLDVNNPDFFEKYKIEDIVFESSVNQYANYLKYESENLISNKLYQEKNISLKDKKISFENVISKINPSMEYTYILRDGEKKPVVIINQNELTSGRYYDLLYKPNSNTLEVRVPNEKDLLFLGYYSKSRFSFEEMNKKDIFDLKKVSGSNGIVYQYEKFNDLSNPNDLFQRILTDIDKKSGRQFMLNVVSSRPIWNLMDVVEVDVNNKELNGKYLVNQVDGNFKVSGDTKIHTYNYLLKHNKNIDNYLNAFDNQSYRDNPTESFNYYFNTTSTFKAVINIIFEEME